MGFKLHQPYAPGPSSDRAAVVIPGVDGTIFRFGLLYSGYAYHMWWWDIVSTLRKLVVVICATFISRDDLQIQTLLIFIFLLIGANEVGKPYANGEASGKELANLETASLTVLFVTLWSGLFFMYQDKLHVEEEIFIDGPNATRESQYMIDTCTNSPYCGALSIFIVALNIMFLIYAVRRLGKFFEDRTHVIAKTRRILTRRSKLFSLKKTSKRGGSIEMPSGVRNPMYSSRDLTGEGEKSSQKKDDIEILVDEETGNRYSHNLRTGLTTWLDDDGEDQGEVALGDRVCEDGGTYYMASEEDKEEEGTWEESGEGTWERHLDAETGDWYESNTVTDEVRWLEDDG